MTRFEKLLELRKLYDRVAWTAYHCRSFRKIANDFVKQSRDLFGDNTLNFKRAAVMTFSLSAQADLIKLDDADDFELIPEAVDEAYDLPEMSEE